MALEQERHEEAGKSIILFILHCTWMCLTVLSNARENETEKGHSNAAEKYHDIGSEAGECKWMFRLDIVLKGRMDADVSFSLHVFRINGNHQKDRLTYFFQ